jgi:cellulose synthase/poly-beta-1,6-N-acetylglucosamine synthase-like glycosyltransferase/peptidoglycan/xylan/chitin deacetylase (PgdA/CDA1 family)/spore germination protein YaaH
MAAPIFHDPSGRRKRRAAFGIGLLVAAILAIFAAFATTLALAPHVPSMNFRDPRVLTALHARNAVRARKLQWTRVPRPGALLGKNQRPLNVGFYVSWDEGSRTSLADHVNQLDIVAPQWVLLKDGVGNVSVTNDPRADNIIAKSTRHPSVMPLVHNSSDRLFNGKTVDALLASPKARLTLINNLKDFAQKRGYSGYIFDFEDLSPQALKLYPGFIAQANEAFNPSGREIWVTAPFDDDDWPLKALAKASDTLVMMAYDEHYFTGDPGPAAGQDWFEKHLSANMAGIDPNKVVVALGSYGLDWTKGGHADPVTFHEATLNAHDSGVDIGFDRASLNPNYAYAEEDGTQHTVWFLDAVTLYNQIHVADAWRPRGYAVWRMGSEDQGVWDVLGKPYRSASPDSLLHMQPATNAVDFNGNGEILNPTATPTPGQRSLTFDKASGLIANEHYDAIPTAYVVQRLGAHPGKVALTFDDGPDPRWTAKILDILKAKNAPATFFVIGENMEMWPDLVKREVDQGETVGSHTYTHPNIALISPSQMDLELNVTQRLFQVITGRTLRLFRPPYLGDASPSTAREVAPLLVAQKYGYLSVGLRIDPDDWTRPGVQPIIQRTLDRLADKNPETGGQVVLLHDSGGDRSQTVAALPILIDQLRAHGYQIVSVADLAGLTPAQAMPPTTEEQSQIWLDRVAFDMVRGFNKGLTALFITAIALGLARLIFLASLALVHRFRSAKQTPPEIVAGPDAALVSVLIPCFDEEAVIVSSVRRILASNWPNLEVLVLDDGSKDETAARVEEAFGANDRVRLMRFSNGGKARALNKGLAVAKGEIVVALDADTQFPPETIGRLARWFRDPKIGAVAGNALVGNRVNLITRWQALEYVTAQNLERRALSALDVITVVPGAVGAWRREAVEALGGFPNETLAEDQDLTLAVQRAGWRVAFDADARAYTEAPHTVRGLLKQRFRWSFGTLQCVWKHRRGLFDVKRPVLGFVALPQVWLFQIFLALVAPLVDLAVIFSVAWAFHDWYAHRAEWNDTLLIQTLLYWAAFVLVDLSAAALGMAFEKKAPWGDMIWLPVQRFGYRQLMYYVVVKAVITAVNGPEVGWGKLERQATVAMDGPPGGARTGKAKKGAGEVGAAKPTVG